MTQCIFSREVEQIRAASTIFGGGDEENRHYIAFDLVNYGVLSITLTEPQADALRAALNAIYPPEPEPDAAAIYAERHAGEFVPAQLL